MFSNNDAAAALEKVPDKVSTQLVLWTSAEQYSIGLAFEKVLLRFCLVLNALLLC